MLQDKILAFRTKLLVKKNDVARNSVSYQKATQVGIIFSAENLKKHESIKRFIKQIEADGKKVKVLTYLPHGTQNFEFLFDHFSKKELSIWGNFDSESVKDFTSQTFDYLFYLDKNTDPIIQNVLAQSKARCRIGNYDAINEVFCEMMVQSPNGNLQSMIDEMYKYTKLLS